MANRVALVVVLFAGLTGCGGSSSAPAPVPGPAPQPSPDTQPGSGQPSAAAGDPYQMDPATHVVPDKPAAGRLGGKPFAPDRVELEGGKLTFAQGKDFFPDLSIDLTLPGDKAPADGAKVVVRPAQPDADTPTIQTGVRSGDDFPKPEFHTDKYALTLEFGKRDKGKLPGKVYLCLPGPQKSYLAGTFVAEIGRGMTEPPGPDDVPYVAGTVTHSGKLDQMLSVGYVGATADGKVVSDGVGTRAVGGVPIRSMTHKPRAATLAPKDGSAGFDFTRLPPGRYLVAARLKDGPSAWAWVEVAAGATPTAALALDPAKVGTVEVKLPAAVKEQINLTPSDPAAEKLGLEFENSVRFVLGYEAEPKDGKATIPNVAPGTYTVRALAEGKPLTATVDVTAGKTAVVEVKAADPPKDKK